MHQSVSGEVGQTVRHDYGEFLQIKFLRVRKDLITSYAAHEGKDEDGTDKFQLQIGFGGHFYAVEVADKAELTLEIEKLDWIFKKDNRAGKE